MPAALRAVVSIRIADGTIRKGPGSGHRWQDYRLLNPDSGITLSLSFIHGSGR
jgi:hypothetical protein